MPAGIGGFLYLAEVRFERKAGGAAMTAGPAAWSSSDSKTGTGSAATGLVGARSGTEACGRVSAGRVAWAGGMGGGGGAAAGAAASSEDGGMLGRAADPSPRGRFTCGAKVTLAGIGLVWMLMDGSPEQPTSPKAKVSPKLACQLKVGFRFCRMLLLPSPL